MSSTSDPNLTILDSCLKVETKCESQLFLMFRSLFFVSLYSSTQNAENVDIDLRIAYNFAAPLEAVYLCVRKK